MTTPYVPRAARGVRGTVAMTAGRRADYARRARARFDKHEQMLRPAIERAIGDYVDEASRRVQHRIKFMPQDLTAAAPLGEDAPGGGHIQSWMTADRADDIVAEVQRLAEGSTFAQLLAQHVRPVYGRMLDEILHAGLHDRRIVADLTQWRGQWLEQRTQQLVGVPDVVTGVFRTQIRGLAEVNGTSVADVEQAAQKLLDRGYPSWTARAATIARTETVASNNQGSLASWSSLSNATGVPATKTWLATEDNATRPDHADIDGTEVGIDGTFSVGGSDMNGPGDESADAEQVINCRCTLTYAFPDGSDAGDLGDELQSSAANLPSEGAPVLELANGLPSALQAAAGAPNTGVAIMLAVSDADTARLAAGGAPVPEWPGFHCTVGYLADPAASYDPAVQGSVIDGLKALLDSLPVTAEAFATAQFNPDSDERDPCAVLLVQSQPLADMHDGVSDVIASMAATTFPIWVPHVALGYNVDVAAVTPAGVTGTDITFDRIVIGWGDTQIDVATAVAPPSAVPDPAVDDPGQQLTAAGEDTPVTAPTAAPPANTAPEATGGDTSAVTGNDLTPHGQQWEGPLAMLDQPSDDGRRIASTGGVIRPLPLPLSWQRESSQSGHEDSVVVGRILACEVRGDMLWGSGDWLDPMTNYDVPQAMAQVEQGLGLISVDLALTEVAWCDETGAPIDPSLVDPAGVINEVAAGWKFGGATIVSFPAFEQARIVNLPLDPADQAMGDVMPLPIGALDGAFAAATADSAVVSDDGTSVTLTDGTSVAVGDPCATPDGDGDPIVGTVASIDATAGTVTITGLTDDDGGSIPDMTVPVAQLVPAPAVNAVDDPSGEMALLASSEVRPYTRSYFEQRDLAGPTPLTVNPETGEVYGHLATFGECHVGKLEQDGRCVTAPHSQTGYADFHLSPILTDKGPLDIGRITVGTGHAMPGGGFANAVRHYDDTGTAVAVVRAYEDDFGIQVTGQVIHDTTPARIEELMRSPLSGDWRLRNGNLELCAALAVNVPGFPVRRPTPIMGLAASLGQVSLVAAGVVEPDPGRTIDAIGLPSGATIARSDFEALVASAAEALAARGKSPAADTAAQRFALRKARARLAVSA